MKIETSFDRLKDPDLLQETKDLVAQERQITLLVLKRLREIERRKLYLGLSYPSLFEFTVKELGYSESAAQRRISAMRLLREVPSVEEKIEKGALSLSVVARAQSFFQQEEKAQAPLGVGDKEKILNSLQGKSAREAERTLLSHAQAPERHLTDRVKPVTVTHSELRLHADAEWLENLEKLRGLLAHQYPDLSLSELLKVATQMALEKLDPARKPQRQGTSPRPSPLPTSVPVDFLTPKTRTLPQAARREIFQRDQGRCTYQDPETKRVCGSFYAPQVDHVKPFAWGGSHETGNLRILCAKHNRYRMEKSRVRTEGSIFLRRS